MKTIYKSILSLATLLACSFMPAWGEDNYTTISGFSYDNGHYTDWGEGYANLVDGYTSTKWCVTSFTSAYIEFHHTEAMHVAGYIITTANDNASCKGRNPKSWILKGKKFSSDEWETIHEVTNDDVLQDVNYTPFTFALDNPTSKKYKYFRLEISSIKSGYVMQMSEFSMLMTDNLATCDGHSLSTHAATEANCASAATKVCWECTKCHKYFADESGTTRLFSIAVDNDLNPDNHTLIVHHAEVPALCNTDGVKEHWKCDGCGKIYGDADCSDELSETDLVIPMLGYPYVQIGSTIGNSSSALAYCQTKYYGGSQALYYKSEIDPCQILSYALYSTDSGYNLEREVWVYMGETTKSDLEKPLKKNELTEVFHGNLVLGQSYGWEEVTLTTPFDYKGKGNLVVAIYSKSDSYASYYYACEYTDNTCGIYRSSWDDSSVADISNTSNSYSSEMRPAIRFSKKMNVHVADPSVISTDGYITCTICGDTHAEVDTLGTVALEDGIDYTRTTPCTVTNGLTYSRNFTTANQWESLYLPLSFEFTQTMADRCEIAEIHTYGITNTENGVIGSQSEKVVLAQPIKVGTTVWANVPYLIRPKSAGKITFTSKDKILYNAEATSVSCGTMRETLTFTGNYEEASNLADSGYYTMQHGQLVKISSNAEYLNSYRWYMTSSSNKTASTINIKSTHVHTDKNADGECDGCGHLFPLTTLVTGENYEELGLTVDHCGYYYIGNYQQLRAAMAMYSEKEGYDPLNFVLTNNIVANASIFDNSGALQSNLKEWNCTFLPQYCTFDGNGHTISGLYCNDSKNDYVGLFSVAENWSQIKNVGITNSYFKGADHQFSQLGGIVGYALYAKISGCWIDSTKLEGGSNFVGGIVGLACYGEITNCQSSADINSYNTIDYSGIHLDLGGIAGLISGAKIVRCQFSGKIQNHNAASIGGIVGFAKDQMSVNDYRIDQCVADGSITLSKGVQTSAAGIVADVIFEDKDESILKVTNCLNKMNIICPDDSSSAAGIAEYVDNAEMKITSCLNVGTISSNKPIVDYANPSADLTISNCYYKGDSNSDFDAEANTYSCTADTLKTGYVALKLNGSNSTAWGQNIDLDNQPVPNHQQVYTLQHGGLCYVNDSIPAFAVKDTADFLNPNDIHFKAHQATYTRKMSNAWGTLCLPFSINYDSSNREYNLYTLHEITKSEDGTSDILVFYEVGDTIIPGGTPLVTKVLSAKGDDDKYTLSINEEDATFVSDTVEVACAATENWLAKGTFKSCKGENKLDPADAAGDIYYIAIGQFWHADVKIDMAAYRGWFEAPKSVNGSAVRRFVIGEWGEEFETGIQIVEDKEDGSVRMIFNLSGQRQSTLQKGMNIVNKEKVLVK